MLHYSMDFAAMELTTNYEKRTNFEYESNKREGHTSSTMADS